MKKWSKYFQNEEFLEKTRMYILNEDMKGYVAEKTGLRPGMKVLDIGCGTGAFSYYLARAVRNISFTGLDNDPDFIGAARKKVPDDANGCSFSFVVGDALQLPFEDGSFDAVVSHTFFNSMPKYRESLREMLRVCREDGVIASVTSIDPEHTPCSGGIYPKDSEYWKKDYDILGEKVMALYEKLVPLKEYIQGIPTRFIPNLFEEERLRDVSAYPIGRFFSLSSKAVPEETKRKFIELSFISDKKRLECVYEMDEAKELISESEVSDFVAVLEKKRDYLLEHIKDNRIWEWEGGTSLLITGRKATESENVMDGIMSLLR